MRLQYQEGKMKRLISIWIVIALFLILTGMVQAQQAKTESYGQGTHQFSLATGSPGELGLLRALAAAFTHDTNTTLNWKKAGSGESLKMLQDKEVDMIMVHAPAAEKKAVQDGWATKRTLVGSNEFFLVGPAADPAKIAAAKNAVDAYTRISKAQAKFFSRGDNSGTHKKEMSIWEKTDIKPCGDWYIVTKDFMTATLKRANAEQGYFMTDSSTWAAEKKSAPNLKVLFRGDKLLVNTYHALCQPAGATTGAEWAAKFIDFVASDRGQQIIRDYGKDKYGEGLYNDSAYAKQYDD
jgi:tungstate transport system substrate-binding protein